MVPYPRLLSDHYIRAYIHEYAHTYMNTYIHTYIQDTSDEEDDVEGETYNGPVPKTTLRPLHTCIYT